MNYLRRGRPRRDQWASPHQKARTLAAERLDEALAEADAEWLERHLEECAPCAVVAADYAMQRMAFRELAARRPEPPRDLWARTAAAIEQESARAGGSRSSARRSGRPSPIPIGVLSGALVVAVVVGVSLFSSDRPITPPALTPAPSRTPGQSAEPAATPLVVPAGDVAWLRQREDGSYGLYVVRIDEVCPGRDKEGCAPIDDTQLQALANIESPSSVVLSPSTDQLVLVDQATDGTGGTVYVVPVPTPIDPLASPTPTLEPTPPPSDQPSDTPGPTGSAEPSGTPSPAPVGATAIASGVVLVGDSAAYSPDGQWFAFSALPADGSHGPDIYVWHVGDAQAHQVTSDHRSVFAAWFGGQLLGSRIVDPDAPSETPGSSGSPGVATPSPTPSPTPSASPSGVPSGSSSPSPAPRDDLTAQTFMIDPVTGAETVFADIAVWRPTVDPSATWAVYWEGTLASNESGTAWAPSVGRLVLGPWPIELPDETVDPSASPSASASAAAGPSPSPSPSATPSAAVTPNPSAVPGDVDGPVQVIEAGRVVDWDVRWDPSGTRLAIWVADESDPTIGRLSLYAVDPETGRFDPSDRVLRDQPALAGFSLAEGLLAWATPPGQDGEGSRVQVLAWSGDSVGSAETTPGSDPVVIIR